MQAGEFFLIAVKFNKVSALRPLLEPFDWKSIPAISPQDINRAFAMCCQNNYVELAQLLLPGADLADDHFNGLCWALSKDHTEIIKLIASRMDEFTFTRVDMDRMKDFHVWDKWQNWKLRNDLTQTVANLGATPTPRKM